MNGTLACPDCENGPKECKCDGEALKKTDGFNGACPTCEPVAEINLKLESRNKEAIKLLNRCSRQIRFPNQWDEVNLYQEIESFLRQR